MAPSPPLAKKRLKAFYTGDFGTHVMLFHGVGGVTDGDLTAAAIRVIEKMAVLQFTGTTWTDAQIAQADDPNYFPITWGPIVQAGGTGPAESDGAGKFLQFGGRGTDGHRVKWYLYEVSAPLRNDMRYELGLSDPVDDVINQLQTESGTLATISGANYTVYSYANIKTNDYLTHRARS